MSTISQLDKDKSWAWAKKEGIVTTQKPSDLLKMEDVIYHVYKLKGPK